MYCDQVPSWECDGSEWTYGNFAYEQIKRERVNHFKKNESAESSNCPCGSLNNGEKQRRTCIVNVLSFPAYCRYRCCLSLMGCGYSLPKKVLLAKGCFEVDCWNTRVVFSRWKFMHPGIDEFIQAEDVRGKSNVYPQRGGTRKNFDRVARVTFLGLKFDNLLFLGGCSK